MTQLQELAELLEKAADEIASEFETPDDYPATATKLKDWAQSLRAIAQMLEGRHG